MSSDKDEYAFEELLLHNWTIDEIHHMHLSVMHPSYQDGKDPDLYSLEMRARYEVPKWKINPVSDELWHDGWEDDDEGHA